MQNLDLTEVVESVKDVFLNDSDYQFRKVIEDFLIDGKFFGDSFNYVSMEYRGSEPPVFYYTFGPYEIITNKAPQQAVVFEDGKCVLDTDFTEYVDVRTGLMDALFLQSINYDVNAHTKIILVGTGKIGRWSIKFLKHAFPNIAAIDYLNKRSGDSDFESICKSIGINAKSVNDIDMAKYDLVICHTSTAETILTEEQIANIKPGAVICTHISSTDHGEIADKFYNSENANVVIDWKTYLDTAKDLNRQVENGSVKMDELLELKELLSNTKKVNNSKKYTIFRTKGTPMQNVAMLKYLLDQK